jgi:hypothetical protein
MKTLFTLIIICSTFIVNAQKSIIDIQPTEVQIVKPTNKSGANAFKIAAGMLIVNGLLGAYLNSQSGNTSGNVPRVSPETVKNLTYVRHATLVVGGVALLTGADSAVSNRREDSNYPH